MSVREREKWKERERKEKKRDGENEIVGKDETRDGSQTQVEELKQEDNITPAQPARAADQEKKGPSQLPNTHNL